MRKSIRILTAAVGLLAAAASMSAVAATSIFTTQVPAVTSGDQQDGSSVELGTRFQSSLDGNIVSLRYYRSTSDTSQHTLSLWDPSISTAAPVATVVTTGDTGGGWKTWPLATPYAIVASQTYVVSYDAPYVGGKDYYVSTDGGLATAIVNGPLTALASGGRYEYPAGVYPTQVYNNGCYFAGCVTAE